jgi:hypothetical protein
MPLRWMRNLVVFPLAEALLNPGLAFGDFFRIWPSWLSRADHYRQGDHHTSVRVIVAAHGACTTHTDIQGSKSVGTTTCRCE